jgi:gamma-glutamyltranspeptidase/glutathione hydrolase
VLDYALRTFGTMPLGRVAEPAVALAEHGYPVTKLQHDLMIRELDRLRAGTAGALVLQNGLTAYPVGAGFRQPVLAGTLRRLAKVGVEDFYRGEIARTMVQDMLANDGLIQEDDLAQIPWPIERRPLATSFGHHRVFTLGPPGAGRALIGMLNLVSALSPRRCDPDTPEGALLLVEVIRRGQIDRADRPYDPHFFPQVSSGRKQSRKYAKRVAGQIRRSVEAGSGETTHLSVADRHGNVVALTQSIERTFGAAAASPELGFLYNNYLSAFEQEDISHPYYLRPNAMPWASVVPTIAFNGQRPWAVLGSPGSERIASAVLQVLLRLESTSPFDAVDAPRLHCSIDGTVSLEASRMRDDIIDLLRHRGFEVDERDPYSFYLGCVQLVVLERSEYVGVADPRRDGSAAGPGP